MSALCYECGPIMSCHKKCKVKCFRFPAFSNHGWWTSKIICSFFAGYFCHICRCVINNRRYMQMQMKSINYFIQLFTDHVCIRREMDEMVIRLINILQPSLLDRPRQIWFTIKCSIGQKFKFLYYFEPHRAAFTVNHVVFLTTITTKFSIL